jgi:hypothetical protein
VRRNYHRGHRGEERTQRRQREQRQEEEKHREKIEVAEKRKKQKITARDASTAVDAIWKGWNEGEGKTTKEWLQARLKAAPSPYVFVFSLVSFSVPSVLLRVLSSLVFTLFAFSPSVSSLLLCVLCG